MPRLRHIAPYDFQYRTIVDKANAGRTLIDFYEERFRFKPRDYWLELIRRGETSVNGDVVPEGYILQPDDVLRTWRRDVTEPAVNGEIEILKDEDGLFILNKRAPIPVHPSGRYFKNTITTILKEQYPEKTFHTIHRLDMWTTGVLLLATDERAAKILHRQIEKKSMRKFYGVLAIGEFGKEPFTIDVPIGRIAGSIRGYGEGIVKPRDCVTRFTPLLSAKFPEFQDQPLSFLKAELLTGRTNQIRVHIQAAGGAVLNDPLYSSHPVDENQIDFMGLHCRQMDFDLGPERPMTVNAPWPEGFLRYFSQAELDSRF